MAQAAQPQAVSFRVLLSNDAVYRFQCLPTHQLKIIFDHIHELSPSKQHAVHHCRTCTIYDGDETIGDCVADGDLLTMTVDEPGNHATTVCLDAMTSMVDLSLYPLDAPPVDDEMTTLDQLLGRADGNNDPQELHEEPVVDRERWRKAHVGRVEANSATLNLSPAEIEHNTRISHHDLMLHAALELTETALTVQHELRLVYLYLRSHQASSPVVKDGAAKLLGLIRRTDRRPVFLHPDIAIAMHGYVDCGRWGALWRTKQRCWAVLWDAKLSFFPSPEAARKYMFALANDRRRGDDGGPDDDIGKRILKEYAPHTEFSLAGWSVRPGAPECDRHTFALFDAAGALRQVVDVAAKAETDAWVRAIAFEAQQHLVRLQAKLATASAPEYLRLLRLRGEDGTPRLPLTPPLKLRVPLKWLHVHLESQDASTRARRLKCSTFTQALKDIQRDVLRINGRLYASSCFEDMLSELAIELLQHSPCQTKSSEMDALAFARQLLIHSSRTHGGGDVLDAVHYLLQTPHFCLCPEMSHAAPVDVQIQLIDGKTVVEIEMTMIFKLIPMAAEHSIARVVGISRQRAVCDMTMHFEVDGEICLEVEAV
ncbi:tyrosyl-DNA phosphodiesterase [Achlya hypogyna]|uniref:Tyrosyl-DNA phosphodiesterase n=1 Tax=Achlya hypogyna TaxID=1202772 RepID=A0A1V9ZU52_ACHHY|nr:tyrosyl-DNA phosphodiesterase [Achlya hypogyna]